MDQSLLLNVSYEFFSLLSRFTTASSLACVAVVSVRFLLGQARQAGKTREAKKEQKRRRRTGGGCGEGVGGGGGADERKQFRFLPRPSLSGSFFLSRLFVLAPLGLKETETTSTQPTSSLKRPFNPYSGHL